MRISWKSEIFEFANPSKFPKFASAAICGNPKHRICNVFENPGISPIANFRKSRNFGNANFRKLQDFRKHEIWEISDYCMISQRGPRQRRKPYGGYCVVILIMLLLCPSFSSDETKTSSGKVKSVRKLANRRSLHEQKVTPVPLDWGQNFARQTWPAANPPSRVIRPRVS